MNKLKTKVNKAVLSPSKTFMNSFKDYLILEYRISSYLIIELAIFYNKSEEIE